MTVLPRPDYWGRLGVAGPTSALVGSYAGKPKSVASMKVNHPLFSVPLTLSFHLHLCILMLVQYYIIRLCSVLSDLQVISNC